jgi:hypothetical protein
VAGRKHRHSRWNHLPTPNVIPSVARVLRSGRVCGARDLLLLNAYRSTACIALVAAADRRGRFCRHICMGGACPSPVILSEAT